MNMRTLNLRLIGWLLSGAAVTCPLSSMAANGIWSNPAGGSWTNSSNWAGGTIADGPDSVADFSTLNITAAATVTLDGNHTNGTLKFADATTASHDWTVNVGTPATSTNMLVSTTGKPLIDVTNRTVTLSAVVTGKDGRAPVHAEVSANQDFAL